MPNEPNSFKIYDVIGPSSFGYTGADQVDAELDRIGKKKALVYLNSPGGSVDEGVAIYNILRRHKEKYGLDIVVDSMAASIASIIALAGDTLVMSQGSRFMIHDPWTVAMGNSRDLRKMADVLDLHRDSLMEIYMQKTGHDAEKIKGWLAEETWFTAMDAVENGFASKVEGVSVEPPKVPQNAFKNVPNDVQQVQMQSTKNRDFAQILLHVRNMKYRSI